MDMPVIGAYSPWALVMGGAGDTAIGRYADFDCADYSSDEYQELARRYLAMSSDNKFMEDDAVAGYGIVTMVAAGGRPRSATTRLRSPSGCTRQEFDLPGYPFDE